MTLRSRQPKYASRASQHLRRSLRSGATAPVRTSSARLASSDWKEEKRPIVSTREGKFGSCGVGFDCREDREAVDGVFGRCWVHK